MSSCIQIINDDQPTLELFQLLLESQGYEVLLSYVATEEVSQIEQQHPDLIIVDAKLDTHAEGLLFLQKLRMSPPKPLLFPSSCVPLP